MSLEWPANGHAEMLKRVVRRNDRPRLSPGKPVREIVGRIERPQSEEVGMVVCVNLAPDGQVGQGWGRANRVAVAEVEAGKIVRWDEIEVGWDRLHDEATEGSHHARIARFLMDHQVSQVGSGHMGPGMQQMLARMGLTVRIGAAGDARQVVLNGVN